MKIISDGLYFYAKTSDKIMYEIIHYFNNKQGTNIAGRSLTRNGFVKFPLVYYPKWIIILQDFCTEKDIKLIWTNHVDSKGSGMSKLSELFADDNAESDSTGISKIDKFLNLR